MVVSAGLVATKHRQQPVDVRLGCDATEREALSVVPEDDEAQEYCAHLSRIGRTGEFAGADCPLSDSYEEFSQVGQVLREDFANIVLANAFAPDVEGNTASRSRRDGIIETHDFEHDVSERGLRLGFDNRRECGCEAPEVDVGNRIDYLRFGGKVDVDRSG